MWALLSILPLFSEIRELLEQIPVSVLTSITINGTQIKMVVKFCLSNSISEFLALKIRSWLSEKLGIGKLTTSSKVHELSYYFGTQKYRVVFPRRRGPKKIISAETQEGKDITQELFEVMGPCGNFHGVPVTPALLGYPRGIKVTYRTGKLVYILGDDRVTF